MTRNPIKLAAKLAAFTEPWTPRVVAEMNDDQFKLVELAGDFVWHRHDDTDEVFITRARCECHAMIVDPRGVVNTGDAGGELTARNDVWV